MPSPGDRQLRVIGQDPVLAYDPAAATVPARACSRHHVEAESLDPDPVSLLGDLHRDDVGLAIAHRDQRILAIVARARAPPARLRLDQQGRLSAVGMGQGQ